MKRFKLFILFSLLSSNFVTSQRSEFDKLDKKLNQIPVPEPKEFLILLNKQKERLDFQSYGSWDKKARFYKNYSEYYKIKNDYNQSLKLARKGLFYANKSNIDTLQASCLHDISLIFIKLNNTDSAFYYLNKALPIFKKNKQYYNLTATYHTLSVVSRKLGNFGEAQKYVQKALFYCDTIKDRSSFATLLNSKALNFQSIGERDSAFYSYLKSLKIYIDLKDVKAQIRTNDQVGSLMFELNRLDEAFKYFNKSLELGRTLKDPVLIGNSSINIGAVYYEQKKIDQALSHFFDALRTAEDYNLERIKGICYSNISDVFKDKKQYRKAIEFALKALQIEKTIGDPTELASCYLNLSEIELAAMMTEESEKHIKLAMELAMGLENQRLLSEIYLQLSNVYYRKGDFRLTHKYYLSYQRIKDELNSVEVNNNIDKLKIKYETDIVSLTNKKLRLENEKKKGLIALEKERTTKLYYIFAGLIVFVLLTSLTFNYSLKNKKQRIQLLSAEKLNSDLIIRNNEAQLSAVQKVLLEKNKLIHSLQDRILVEQNHEGIANELIQNLKDHNNWATFINQFEIIHSGYLSAIVDKHPDLSKNDIRLIVLEKLFLTTKEMGEILGISPESVTKGKQRLKKKLDL